MSVTRHHVQTLLEDAGARSFPEPSLEFVQGLEARLLVDAPIAAPAALVTPLQGRSRARFVRPVLVAAAAAVAAVVLAGSLAGWYGRDQVQQRKLELAASVDTTVVLPDGTELAGTDGLDLPDGTVVRTGPKGHAAVGNVDLGPSQIAVVDAGRIQISVPDVTLPPITPPTDPTGLLP
jgi:hypothetical protein